MKTFKEHFDKSPNKNMPVIDGRREVYFLHYSQTKTPRHKGVDAFACERVNDDVIEQFWDVWVNQPTMFRVDRDVYQTVAFYRMIESEPEAKNNIIAAISKYFRDYNGEIIKGTFVSGAHYVTLVNGVRYNSFESVIGVEVDRDYYRLKHLRDIMVDDTTDEEGTIMDL